MLSIRGSVAIALLALLPALTTHAQTQIHSDILYEVAHQKDIREFTENEARKLQENYYGFGVHFSGGEYDLASEYLANRLPFIPSELTLYRDNTALETQPKWLRSRIKKAEHKVQHTNFISRLALTVRYTSLGWTTAATTEMRLAAKDLVELVESSHLERLNDQQLQEWADFYIQTPVRTIFSTHFNETQKMRLLEFFEAQTQHWANADFFSAHAYTPADHTSTLGDHITIGKALTLLFFTGTATLITNSMLGMVDSVEPIRPLIIGATTSGLIYSYLTYFPKLQQAYHRLFHEQTYRAYENGALEEEKLSRVEKTVFLLYRMSRSFKGWIWTQPVEKVEQALPTTPTTYLMQSCRNTILEVLKK